MSIIKKTLTGLVAVSLVAVASVASASALNGTKWNTIDDETGKARSVVQFTDVNGTVHANIVEIFNKKNEKDICTKCEGELKNKPILGLKFLSGFKSTDNKVWESGSIVDPESGSVYKGTITLKGDKLDLRGYVGWGAFSVGRTQTWVKAK